MYLEHKEYAQCEELMVKAKRPDLAVKMYQDETMWEDALRIAEQYMPAKVKEIRVNMAAALAKDSESGGKSVQAVIAKVNMLEKGHAYSQAVDACLEATTETWTDLDALEQERQLFSPSPSFFLSPSPNGVFACKERSLKEKKNVD